MSDRSTSSKYLRHLPQVLREPVDGGEPFLGRYLLIFEALLSGHDEAVVGGKKVEGLEEVIAKFVEYLDPLLVPVDPFDDETEPLTSEFLTYLASWVALTLDENWDLGRKREWLRRIVPLYKRRGTRDGLQAYLEMFLGRKQVKVDEPGGLVIAETSTVALDTFVGDPPPYFFRVFINYAFPAEVPELFDLAEWKNIIKGARAIIDLEKPAHTHYWLDQRTPGFVVAKRATIAEDTLLWNQSRPVNLERC